jgi:hypothetical protein
MNMNQEDYIKTFNRLRDIMNYYYDYVHRNEYTYPYIEPIDFQISLYAIDKQIIEDVRKGEDCSLWCPTCGRRLQRNMNNNYCPRCGQRIRWE